MIDAKKRKKKKRKERVTNMISFFKLDDRVQRSRAADDQAEVRRARAARHRAH